MMDRQIDSPIPTPLDFVSGLVELTASSFPIRLAAPPTAVYAVASGDLWHW